ncbi:MAG: hypothetical protein EOO05_06815 [Chitinophagaceae bacterium]|nr:MAG: hypothetical protein EOO05_06815 [Chitinophagaceae bacterium]
MEKISLSAFRSVPQYASIIMIVLALVSCNSEPVTATPDTDKNENVSGLSTDIQGTWQLIDGTLIEKGDTVVNDYTKKLSCIKIINDTHFSFLQHDLHKGEDSAVFVAGGGRYDLKGDQYTEHLEYCNDRQWEGNDFTFTLKVSSDTLIQQGREKIESAGVDRLNTERYVRVKKT